MRERSSVPRNGQSIRKRAQNNHRSSKAGKYREAPRTAPDVQNKLLSIPATIPNTSHVIEHPLITAEENPVQLLIRDALEELTRKLESTERSTKQIANGRSDGESEDKASQGSDADLQERYRYNWCYVPPLGEETVRMIKAVVRNPACAQTIVGIGPEHAEFLPGLRN